MKTLALLHSQPRAENGVAMTRIVLSGELKRVVVGARRRLRRLSKAELSQAGLNRYRFMRNERPIDFDLGKSKK